MTEEEVSLIYDYLHENYRYEDGQLIRLYDARLVKAGHSLGSKENIQLNPIKITNSLYGFIR